MGDRGGLLISLISSSQVV
ncbi:hypothetical protein OIU84_029497 [Salix udensis]|uniref:Uncharacterized protein n=1 Tax=Salix udensis TaxID=889485 RepID=A0AAD6P7A0_9ROSI|nr:hypothetical protein OIU84_029497 [Salix udensis]